MSSSLAARGIPILPFFGVDLSAALGKLIVFNAGVPAVNASTNVPAIGIVLDGNIATKESSIGILAGNLPPVRALISAAAAPLTQGATLQQAADGTLTNDAGPGNVRVVVGVLSDPNGAQPGDLAEVTFFSGPDYRT
jgi:hypothetical protein